MNRLNFSLPEFTRVVWASEKLRLQWKPKIDAINNCWQDIERLSVVHGIRPGGLQSVAPENLIAFQSKCFRAQLQYVIVAQEGTNPVYSNASKPVEEGQPWNYRIYFGADPMTFLRAWTDNDQALIGEFLGYPSCCSEFFQANWVTQGWRDLTYPMLRNGAPIGPLHCNILLRHIGVRPVFHLPCNFSCEKTKELSKRIIEVGISYGYAQEMQWLQEVLSWSVRWSSMHGVAIITTPVLKIITSSDSLGENVDFSRPAAEEVGVTLEFHTRKDLIKTNKDNWSENGFASHSAMLKGHDLIKDTIANLRLVSGLILDLGCGNGVLLRKIALDFPFLVPHGVEYVYDRYVGARSLLGETIIHCDLWETKHYLNKNYEVVMISLSRFKEVEKDQSEELLKKLREHTIYLLVYSYEPWDSDFNFLFDNFDLFHQQLSQGYEARAFRLRGSPDEHLT